MGNTEPNNTKKLTVIITYTLAVVCLLLGLLLPFFHGKGVEGMLVMQLPKALDIVCGSKGTIDLGNTFVASQLIPNIALFGVEKLRVDITAWAIVAYAVITLLALLAFIPMGITFKKNGKITRIFAYVIEIAAVLVLSLYVVLALENAQLNEKAQPQLNMLVAVGGTLVMLIIQCFVNKSAKSAGVKFVLLLLSMIAAFGLFNFYLVSPKFNEFWLKAAGKLKCSPELYGTSGVTMGASGIGHLQIAFESNVTDALKLCPTAADKTMLVLGIIIGLVTLLNYFIDVIGLSTNAKRLGLIFNIVRYGITFLAAICLFVTVAVAKSAEGLSLSMVFVIVAIELAINLGILLKQVVKSKKAVAATGDGTESNENKEEVSHEQPLEYGVNDYSNIEREPEPVAAQEEEPEEPEPYKEPYKNPYANPYAQPFGSEQPSYLDPFASAKFETKKPEYQPEPERLSTREKPAPAPLYDPTEGYPADYFNDTPDYQPPVQEYNPVQDYRNYQPVQDYQPAKQPVQNEQPKAEPTVHNVYSTYPPVPNQEQPERIYKVNTVYQGPTDEFLRKLTNDEKIEFAMIFIEKSKGEIGRVPDYRIGGDNKKFFNSVFIYLGRIRGIISDGLLNKMYKEINMFR